MTDKPKTYATAMAFRRALEDRLKQIAKAEKFEFQRLMREVAFDRLLARLFAREDAPWLLKGGYAMELRLKDARATKDLDLALRQTLGSSGGGKLDQAILAALRAAATAELNDFFTFEWESPCRTWMRLPRAARAIPSNRWWTDAPTSNSISTSAPATSSSLLPRSSSAGIGLGSPASRP
jgi:hypothetical protein